jgi:DNA gyrase inhibitor GyrI
MLNEKETNSIMEMKLEKLSPLKIMYMRRTGCYGLENKRLMEQFKQWVNEQKLFNDDTVILGITQDNPQYVSSENCRYDTCIVISSNEIIKDKRVKVGHIHEGLYMVFIIPHTEKSMQQAWSEVFSRIALENYSINEKVPIIERYQAKMVKNHFCEICVPVNKKIHK